MIILFVTTILLIIAFYGKIFFTEQTRKENKENKINMEFYNRDHNKTKPTIKDYKTTNNS